MNAVHCVSPISSSRTDDVEDSPPPLVNIASPAKLPTFVSYGDQSVQAMRTQPVSEDRVILSPMPRAALATPCRLFSPVTSLGDLGDEIEKFSMEFTE